MAPRFTRVYPGENVYEAALERMRRLYREYDNVLVSFSGGKDSLVVLHLARIVAEELDAGPVKALFFDEEVIHQSVADFVDEYRRADWCDLAWWTVPLESHKYLLGIITDYIQWDPARDPAVGGAGWVRDRPEWGLTLADLGLPEGTVLGQAKSNRIATQNFTGSTVVLTGVRADESLLRLSSFSSNGALGVDYWLSPGQNPALGRPIADWTELDVFRFFYDHGIRYCPIYDAQLWTRLAMRVGTAITSEGAKQLDRLAAADPDLFEAVLRVWPELAVQARYHRDYDRQAPLDRWGESFDTVEEWINANLDTKWRKNALAMLRACRREPDRWPPRYLMHSMLADGYKRGVLVDIPAEDRHRWLPPARPHDQEPTDG